jgi:hypothetical protein
VDLLAKNPSNRGIVIHAVQSPVFVCIITFYAQGSEVVLKAGVAYDSAYMDVGRKSRH